VGVSETCSPIVSRRTFLQTGATITAGALLSKSAKQGFAQGKAGPVLTGRDISDVISLDPHRAYEFTFLLTDQGCYDTLITFDKNNFARPVPRLATTWQVTPDAKTLTFQLRSGVKFASGNPLTADVYKWSLERLQRIQGNPSYLLDSVESVEAPSDTTLIIKLKDPDSTFLSVLASPFFAPVDRELIKQNGGTNDDKDKADGWLTDHSAGTGSYQISSFKRNSRLDLGVNPNAWAPPKIGRMLVNHFGESAALRLALQRGDVELVAGSLPSDELAQLRGKPHVRLAETPSFVFFYVGWTQDPGMSAPLANPKVGQAIKHAMNYESYKTLFPGSVRPAAQVPLVLPGALPGKDGVPYDPAQAKKLLREAGYPNGFDLTISTQTGTHFGYRWTVVAQKVQQDLAKVGIRGQLDIEEESIHLKKMRAGEKAFVVQLTWADFPDALSTIWWFSPVGPWGKRSRGWKDDQLVTLISEARATVDPVKRTDIYRRAGRRLIERSPFAVLFQVPQSIPYRDSLTNVYPDLLTIIKPQAMGRA
jgi:peptide/nickel transport system substrate-binding protein